MALSVTSAIECHLVLPCGVTSAPTLRDHARDAVRGVVMRQAWLLFSRQGFEATTIDQIAAAAGMSRRTFFRYFTGKDELVLARLVESGESVVDALRERPTDEPVWTSLRRAFDGGVVQQETHADIARPLLVMLRTEPGVRGSVVEWRRRWQELLEPVVAERLPRRRAGSAPDVRAAAIVASALSCLETAQDAWADHPHSRLSSLLDHAMTAVAG
jgi:AcrR family transcriptional regulator